MGRSEQVSRTLEVAAALAVLACTGLVAGCGGGGSTAAVVAPSTTSTTEPLPQTVPAFGSPAAPLPATAANATSNAEGACSQFNRLYLQLAQGGVPRATAEPILTAAVAFADHASSAAPQAWRTLLTDTQALADYVHSPAWVATTSQITVAPVQTVYHDCRPLQ
ncbi:MAG: hypothetical protein ACRDZY_08930 [Acidimicrobiales bacterium]